MSSVNYIIDQLDSIVYDDLGSIRNVFNESLPDQLFFIKELIDKAIISYGEIVKTREHYVEKLQNFTEKVDEFLEDKISKKLQKLKTGLLYIKSKTNLEEPNPGFILY